MPLTLLAGPANAGKVALLLDRYLAEIGREPILIVPNRADVDRVERELLVSAGALLGGTIGTFDDVFREIARGSEAARPVATDAQRTLIAQRVLASVSLNGLGASAKRNGFVPVLLAALGELQSGLLEPDAVDGDLGRLYAAYRAELDRLGLWDRDLLRARAAERIASELDAWHGRPVFAYGFEDLTGAEWRLLEALAGRTDVTISLPYEPGRPAFEAVQTTAEDLARLAAGRVEELPARLRQGRPSRACPSRARALLRRASAAGCDRRGGSLPRGRRDARRARARGGRGARARPRRDGSRADRRHLPERRTLRRPARHGVRRGRNPVRARGCDPASAHRVRRCALLPASLRLARWQPRHAVRVPALAVLRAAAPSGPTSSRAACAGAASAPPIGSRRRPRSSGPARCATSRRFAPSPTRSKPCAIAPAR